MARRPKGSESDSTTLPRLTVSRSDLDRRLEDRITRGRELLDRSIASPSDLQAAHSDYGKWDDYNTTLLRRSFSSSEPADEYSAPVPMIQSPCGELVEAGPHLRACHYWIRAASMPADGLAVDTHQHREQALHIAEWSAGGPAE